MNNVGDSDTTYVLLIIMYWCVHKSKQYFVCLFVYMFCFSLRKSYDNSCVAMYFVIHTHSMRYAISFMYSEMSELSLFVIW